MDNTKNAIWDALLASGACLYDQDKDSETFLDLNLSEILDDSIKFIGFIVELEQALNIQIPDNYLSSEKFATVKEAISTLEMCENDNGENDMFSNFSNFTVFNDSSDNNESVDDRLFASFGDNNSNELEQKNDFRTIVKVKTKKHH